MSPHDDSPKDAGPAALGVGPGRGLGLMMICLGPVFATGTLLALAWPRMRRLEDVIPDAIADAPAT